MTQNNETTNNNEPSEKQEIQKSEEKLEDEESNLDLKDFKSFDKYSISVSDSINVLSKIKPLLVKWKKKNMEPKDIWIDEKRTISNLTEKETMESWCLFEPRNYYFGDINKDGFPDVFCIVDASHCGGGSAFMYVNYKIFFVSDSIGNYNFITLDEESIILNNYKDCRMILNVEGISADGLIKFKFFEHDFQYGALNFSIFRYYEYVKGSFIATNISECMQCGKIYNWKESNVTFATEKNYEGKKCTHDFKYRCCSNKCLKKDFLYELHNKDR